MIQPPFKVKIGQSGVWIEDSAGLSIADINPLIEDRVIAFRTAELLVNGTNSYLRRVELAREVGKKGGRPPKKLKKTGEERIKKVGVKGAGAKKRS
jgi:hypothetical protein